VAALRALIESAHEVIAVYTQPDRPSLKDADAQQQLQALNADLMVVTAYGLLLPPQVLQAPQLGCINIHASLLPRWRGAAPIQRAILAGDKKTGCWRWLKSILPMMTPVPACMTN